MADIEWRDLLGWNGEQLHDLRLLGYDYLRQGHYKRAIIFFEALVSLDPHNFFDRFTLGALYLQTKEYVKALESLNQALHLDPSNLAAQLNKAKALLSLNQIPEGVAIVRELSRCEDPKIRDLSEALVMAWG